MALTVKKSVANSPLYVRNSANTHQLPIYTAPENMNRTQPASQLPATQTSTPQRPGHGLYLQPSPLTGGFQDQEFFDQQGPQVGVTSHNLSLLADPGIPGYFSDGIWPTQQNQMRMPIYPKFPKLPLIKSPIARR